METIICAVNVLPTILVHLLFTSTKTGKFAILIKLFYIYIQIQKRISINCIIEKRQIAKEFPTQSEKNQTISWQKKTRNDDTQTQHRKVKTTDC